MDTPQGQCVFKSHFIGSTTDGVEDAIQMRTASVLTAYTSRYYGLGLHLKRDLATARFTSRGQHAVWHFFIISVRRAGEEDGVLKEVTRFSWEPRMWGGEYAIIQDIPTRSTLGVNCMMDYDGVRLCLRTAATNRPIVYPPSDMWARRTMVMMMMLAGDNSWLDHQSSLAVLPAETSGESRRNERRNENFVYRYMKYLKGPSTCCTILRHGTSGFTYYPKEGVLRILSPLKIHRLSRVLTRDPWVQWQAH
jgi:hypothetical protein